MSSWVGTVLLSCAYLALLVWALRSETRTGKDHGWRDLRWWIAALVAMQLALYWWF